MVFNCSEKSDIVFACIQQGHLEDENGKLVVAQVAGHLIVHGLSVGQAVKIIGIDVQGRHGEIGAGIGQHTLGTGGKYQ